ncbi:MAG TPA: chemotaxis protein CheB [Thermoanaerobaculia bacterium]
MPGHDIILIGASAGGVQATSELVGSLPADLPAAVFVVVHLAPFGTSAMPAILSRSGPLKAVHPTDGEPIQQGRIYVAPPDHHLVIEDGHVRLSRAPTENGHRPAVDVLFRSGALAYGPRAVGVVLTGNLDDGTAGLATLKKHGGIAVVQDPAEADYSGMPRSAVENVAVDHICPLGEIAPLLTELAHRMVEDPTPPEADSETHDMKNDLEHGVDREGKGRPSAFTCPDCGGTLFEKIEEELAHFRCRVGHAYSLESLLARQVATLEATLWAAARALEENAALARRMEGWMRRSGKAPAGEARYARRAEEAEHHAEALRRILLQEPAKTG